MTGTETAAAATNNRMKSGFVLPPLGAAGILVGRTDREARHG
jgi:hypothetical protein